jgi:FtsH-binding integral membrane protein
MATATATSVTSVSSLPGRRYDHRFFNAMSLVMLLTILYGFSRTYFLAGGLRAPLPSPVIHLHAVVFTLWVVFLVVQTTLTHTGNVQMHRRLGVGGFILAGSMLPLGVLAATDSLVRRNVPIPGRDPLAFYIVPITGITMFAIIMYFALRYRKDSSTHKRLVYVATASIMLAAIARMPIPHVYRNPLVASLFVDAFILALVAYDLWSTHNVHRATIYAGTAVIVVQLVRLPLSHTAAWLDFARWVQSVAQ